MRNQILGSFCGVLALGLFAQCTPVLRGAGTAAAAGIIGGTPVDATSDLASSIGLIVRRVSQEQKVMSYCTGTFIAPDVLLTAAHCVVAGEDPENLRIKHVTRVTDGEFLRVKTFIRHPNYNDDIPYKDDLALIRLEKAPAGVKPLNFKWSVAPTALSWKFLALGYGQSMPLSKTIESDAGFLRSVELQAEFYEPELFYFKVNTSNGKGICYGDSGGPALWIQNGEYLLLGVASFVEERDTGACNLSALYNNVPYYRTWIEEHLEQILKR